MELMSCPICHEIFTSTSDIILVKHTSDLNIENSRKRGHYFHASCMNIWMKEQPCCPMDRDSVKTMFKIRYYELQPIDLYSKHYTALLNEINITDKMLVNISDINSLDDDGKSLAYCACQKGNYSLVIKLLKRGANFHLADSNGFTPLMAAVSNNYYEIVKKILINRKAKSRVDQCDKYGKNAFSYACQNNCITIIREMLDNQLVNHHQVRTCISDRWDQFQKNRLFGKEILDLMFHYLKNEPLNLFRV